MACLFIHNIIFFKPIRRIQRAVRRKMCIIQISYK